MVEIWHAYHRGSSAKYHSARRKFAGIISEVWIPDTERKRAHRKEGIQKGKTVNLGRMRENEKEYRGLKGEGSSVE